MRCATWMFFGPNSRAIACATARRPNLALANAAKPLPPRKRRSRAGEEDVALAARQHQPRRLASGEEAGIAGHLPHFPEHPLGGFQDREIDVGADVEDADFQRRMLVGVIEEGDDLLLLARIERTGMDLAAGRLDLLDQRLELGAVAAAGENRKSLGGKLLGDLAADKIAGADDRNRRVSLLHGSSPALE